LTGRVVQRLVDLSPDIVHIHSLSFPRHVRQVRDALRDTRIIVQDHADQPIGGWRRNLVRASLDGIDAASFTAAVQAKRFLAAGVLDERARIFEVPESSSMFTPGDQATARSVTGLHGDPCVLWLGHLDENKDPLVALDAIRIAAGSIPDIRLWMAWLEAPLLDVVRQRVQRHAVLRERVMLLGPQPHSRVQGLLRAADLLIQASHNEGSGYAVIESMACGTAPVVTDIPSFRVLTGEGRAGGLSPIGDAAAMAASIEQWAAVPAGGRRARVRDHFERDLSFNAIGARWRAIYQDLLAR
jgi:glycosyltransferase involved in cell wall biosynthesis